ncbi:MAG: APC family permease [Firmicutes bacterium]|nr:APC family permease [Bacillota bacterium]
MEQQMEKRYGLPTAICMVVGIVIGSGIFFKTEAVLQVTGGNALTGVLSLLIMGIIMFFCAYAFSVLAQKYNKVNGLVDYAEATCGPKYAYYLGWYMTMIYTPAITSVLCWVSAMYFMALFGFGSTSGETMVLAGFFLIGDALLNAVAPRIAGKLQVSTTVIKMIPLVLMAVIGIGAGMASGQLAHNFQLASMSDVSTLGGLTASVVSLAFAFEGWILATSINAELKDAKKNLPRALIIGAVIIVAVYVFYYLGICGAISVEELMQSGSTQAFKNIFGDFFGTLLSVFIVISCLGTVNGLMMANARSMYSIAMRGNGPKPALFARVDETTNMPINSTFFGAFLVMIWLLYFFGANLSSGWFGLFNFDSSELVIVALYAMYIPIFLKMYQDKELSGFKRTMVPTLAIFSCLFLVGCAVYSHGIVKYQAAAANGEFAFPVLFFCIVTAVVLFIGKLCYNSK